MTGSAEQVDDLESSGLLHRDGIAMQCFLVWTTFRLSIEIITIPMTALSRRQRLPNARLYGNNGARAACWKRAARGFGGVSVFIASGQVHCHSHAAILNRPGRISPNLRKRDNLAHSGQSDRCDD